MSTPLAYPGGLTPATAAEALIYANFCQQAYFEYYILNNVQAPFGFPAYSDVLALPPAGYKVTYQVYYELLFDWVYFGYVAANTTTGDVVLVLRGTETTYEWSQNLLYSSQAASSIPGASSTMTHEGFDALYQSLKYFPSGSMPSKSNAVPLATVLQGVTSAVVTGHSLGAALATLLTLDLALNIASLTSLTCYSFASPAVGNAAFAALFDSTIAGNASFANYRVANGWDRITTVPPGVFYYPDIPFGTPGENIYVHVSSFCPVDSGLITAIGDPHSLTNYALGLNYAITPPSTSALAPSNAKGLRAVAASLQTGPARKSGAPGATS